MSADRPEFTSDEGVVYLIPFDEQHFILAQVGNGGDLGVFEGLYTSDASLADITPKMLFRVQFGRLSPKKFKWRNLGLAPFRDGLADPQPYFYRAIGSDDCRLLTYGQTDAAVDCSRASEFEAAEIWSHEHIVDRFRQEHRSGIAN